MTCIKPVFRLFVFILLGFKTGAAFGQAPVISYTSPQVYTVNKTIASLAPANTGGVVPANAYGQVTTFAGNGTRGAVNAIGKAASFYDPVNTVFDGSGNMYVSDQANYLIRKIAPSGAVSTLAGTGSSGSANGIGTSASFNYIGELAFDASGNLYVADGVNHLIRKIVPSSGQVSTFAGSGTNGISNGTVETASFGIPSGVAFDKLGNMYVSDQYYNQIRKITPGGAVTTFAGSGAKGNANGAGVAASFNILFDIAADAAGNIYVADAGNNQIRKITPGGTVSTFAGSGLPGSADGNIAAASFNYPTGVTIDAIGNVYVCDGNNLVRVIDPTGNVTTLAGGSLGYADGIGAKAEFSSPAGLSYDGLGNIFVSDEANNAIRKISITGYTINKQLPPGLTFNPTTGIVSGTPTAASPSTSYTVTAYNTGGSSSTVVNITVKSNAAVLPLPPNISYQTPQTYYVNTPITPLTPANTGGPVPASIYGQVSTVAGNLSQGNVNGTGAAASFGNPVGLICDAAGNLYVSEYVNNDIRKVTASGIVSAFAGNGNNGNTNGTSGMASFSAPYQLAIDAAQNIYVADEGNQAIRKISPAGTVTTFAGNNGLGTNNGAIATASFDNPIGVVIDATGNMYVADRGNNTIRKIDPTGQVTTFSAQDGGSTPPDDVSGLYYLASDASSNLYFVNTDQVESSSPAAVVNVLAGSGTPGYADGNGAAASFDGLVGIAVSPAGYIYVGDVINNRIRQISATGTVTTLAGNGGHGSNDGLSATASFNHPYGVTVDPTGNFLYVADMNNNLIRKINITGYTLDKSLPTGLSFNPSTGIISGTPSFTSPAETYTITAYNSGGSSTATVSIQIDVQAITFGAIPPKSVCDADFDPGATGVGAINYTSSNPAVATIVSGEVHITGTGTSVITATNGGIQVPQTLTVTPAVTPALVITPEMPDTCQGESVTFAAQIQNGGAAPVLQWQVNGQNVGTGGTQFSTAALNNGDKIACMLTSNATCTTTATVASNTATFSVAPPQSTSVAIVSSAAGPICPGTPVTFTATANTPDASPVYQWQVNGVNAGTNQSTFTTSNLTGGSAVTCILTSAGKCIVPPQVTSNSIVTTLSPQSECSIVIPNTFTPNGDGINDLWDISDLQSYPGCTVSIYNRYGGLVYNSVNYPKAWDGTYNGKALPVGTYYYIINLKNGKKPLAGSITLLR